MAYSRLQLALKYLRYWIAASNSKGHGIHSPFVYHFIEKVLNDERHFYAYDEVEILRATLEGDQTLLTVEDLGAGSVTGATKQRTVSSIALNAVKPRKYGQLLFRMVEQYQPETLLELGTSLGITTQYLARAMKAGALHTIEGAAAVAAVADAGFREAGLDKITLHQGDFNHVLPGLLEQIPPVDFAFIDGNHREAPTLDYFNRLLAHHSENAVLIFDDIHWSEEMERAWKAICTHQEVMLSVDLFFIGIVFFNPQFRVKQHFRIRF